MAGLHRCPYGMKPMSYLSLVEEWAQRQIMCQIYPEDFFFNSKRGKAIHRSELLKEILLDFLSSTLLVFQL